MGVLQGNEPEKQRTVDRYRDLFECTVAESVEDIQTAFRLRYQVYCLENGFEDPNQFPDGLEYDAYDLHAQHALLWYRPTGEPVGTVRCIHPQPDHIDRSFPFQDVAMDATVRDPEAYPLDRMAEISRFCVSKRFRQRKQDGHYPANLASQDVMSSRRMVPNMMLGLIEGVVRMSVESDTDYWCAVMEPSLLRLLGNLGIHFDAVGDTVDYHGIRQPCYQHLPTLLNRTHEERPDIWELITADGAHTRTYAQSVDAVAPAMTNPVGASLRGCR